MIKVNKKLNYEYNQSFIRLNIVILISIYLYIYIFISDLLISDFNKNLIILFYFISAIELIYSSIFYNTENVKNNRIAFRVITNAIDNILLAVALISFEQIGIPLFVIYLWITFGIGLRYGIKYLILSTVLNILSFSLVIYISPIWHSYEMLPFSLGLLVAFIVLPWYVNKLISNISVELDSEKRVNKIRQNFIATLNHEFRTPLSSISNITEILKSKRIDNNIYKSLNMISISAKSLLCLISNILDISKIKSDEGIIEYQAFNLYELIYQVKNIIEPHCAIKKIKIYFYIDTDCYPYLNGAYNQIKQILINLGSNAAKFTNKGYVCISIRVIENFKNQQVLSFEVKDTGIGIDSKNISKIFYPYTQADKEISNIYGGTGLGISIANEFAKMMDTRITVDSDLGKGSKFKFILKINKDIEKIDYQIENIKIYIYTKEDQIEKVIHEYSTYFSNSISVIKISNLEDVVESDGLSIIFVDTTILNLNEEIIRNFTQAFDIPVIEILNGNSSSGLEFVTSCLMPEFSRSSLKNSIMICNEIFLNNNYVKNDDINILTDYSKILIVEDDPVQREINKALLTTNINMIDIVANGNDALKLLEHNIYDAILIDYYLPDILGSNLAIQISKKYKNTSPCLILMTAEDRSIINDEKIINIFNKIFIKPLKINHVIDYLKNNRSRKYILENTNEFIDESNNLVDISFIKHICMKVKICDLNNIVELYDEEVILNIMQLYRSILNKEQTITEDVLHKLKGVSATIGAIAFNNLINESIKVIDQGKQLDIYSFYKLFNSHINTISYIRDYINKNVN